MFITCLFLAGCDREQQEEVTVQEQIESMKTIVAMGDSLTAGYGIDENANYPSLLEGKLHEAGYNYRVVNAGVSSETSSGTLSRMEWILTLNPDILILETGANDGLRGIDTKLLEDNLRKILIILDDNDVVVLLAGMKMVWNLGPLYVARFNTIYPQLAKEFDTVFMPFFLEGVAMKKELNLGDGLHPNEDGYKVIAENIYPYVVKSIKQREE